MLYHSSCPQIVVFSVACVRESLYFGKASGEIGEEYLRRSRWVVTQRRAGRGRASPRILSPWMSASLLCFADSCNMLRVCLAGWLPFLDGSNSKEEQKKLAHGTACPKMRLQHAAAHSPTMDVLYSKQGGTGGF